MKKNGADQADKETVMQENGAVLLCSKANNLQRGSNRKSKTSQLQLSSKLETFLFADKKMRLQAWTDNYANNLPVHFQILHLTSSYYIWASPTSAHGLLASAIPGPLSASTLLLSSNNPNSGSGGGGGGDGAVLKGGAGRLSKGLDKVVWFGSSVGEEDLLRWAEKRVKEVLKEEAQ